jgi:YidC/Oxa1 family membrane protein insertase
MARNTWLAVALCFLIWFVYMRWFAPIPAPAPAPPPAATTGTADSAARVASPSAPSTTASAVAASSVTWNVAAAAASLSPTGPKLENADIAVVFDPVQGRPAEIAVKRYRRDGTKKDSPLVTPLDPMTTPSEGAALFSDATLQALAKGPFTVEQEGRIVRYRAERDGFRLERAFTVPERGFQIGTTLRLTLPENAPKELGYLYFPLGAKTAEHDASDPLKSWEIVAYIDDRVERHRTETLDVGVEKVLQGTTHWLAYGNRFFASVLLNRSQLNPDVVFWKQTGFEGGALRYPVVRRGDGSEFAVALDWYVGPKNYETFKTEKGLRYLIDYGFFSWLAFPLLEALRFFFQFTKNYGIAIILLTVVVRVLFYPLALKSSRSMKAMQRLQPQIQALREKFKNDPQRLNREQLALFRAHKVNPMGGCLPLLVQLPVFFALYAVLGNSIELHQAPFFGWIHDLSAKDPYYVLPVLMGIAMFLQQKITPTPGMDPTQAKILLFMPIVFTFVMLNLPSGLTLYIFVSTLLGILQQWAMNRDRSTPATQLVTTGAPPTGR